MGGDRAPAEVVAGAVRAAAELGIDVLLVGPKARLGELLPPDSGVRVVDAPEVIEMSEDPVAAVRSKPRSSVVRAVEEVREGRAQACVSAGNTGATTTAALIGWGRLAGVERPALAVSIPVPGHDPQLLIDGGSTVDCQPHWLSQWARMGRAYAQIRLGTKEPTIGLLSIGEEAGKGDTLRKEAAAHMQILPGFVGNVEGRDLIAQWPNVVITDGFTGNVVLKTMERTMHATATFMLSVMTSTEQSRAASDVLMPLLLEGAAQLQPENVGGAVLLGVDGVCVVAHGSSGATAIRNAIEVARDAVHANLVRQVKEELSYAN